MYAFQRRNFGQCHDAGTISVIAICERVLLTDRCKQQLRWQAYPDKTGRRGQGRAGQDREPEKTSCDDYSTCRPTRYVCLLIDAARNVLRSSPARQLAELCMQHIAGAAPAAAADTDTEFTIHLSAAALVHATHRRRNKAGGCTLLPRISVPVAARLIARGMVDFYSFDARLLYIDFIRRIEEVRSQTHI